MNWTRGLIRLWLLGSIAWAYLVGVDEWDRASWLCRQTIAIDGGAQCGSLQFGAVLAAAVFAVATSLAVFIIGAGVVWVMRGFLREEAQP